MDDAPQNGHSLNGSEEFLALLERGVREIVKNRKSSKGDKLKAIDAGTKLLAIRHKINGGDDSKGFFG